MHNNNTSINMILFKILVDFDIADDYYILIITHEYE